VRKRNNNNKGGKRENPAARRSGTVPEGRKNEGRDKKEHPHCWGVSEGQIIGVKRRCKTDVGTTRAVHNGKRKGGRTGSGHQPSRKKRRGLPKPVGNSSTNASSDAGKQTLYQRRDAAQTQKTKTEDQKVRRQGSLRHDRLITLRHTIRGGGKLWAKKKCTSVLRRGKRGQ